MVSPSLPSFSMASNRAFAASQVLVAPAITSMSLEVPADRICSLSWGIHSLTGGIHRIPLCVHLALGFASFNLELNRSRHW